MTMRITNRKRFTQQIKRFSKLSGIDVATVAKLTAFRAFGSVIEKTPVDTGWARASWNFTADNIDTSVPPKPSEPPPPPIAQEPVTTSTLPKYYITNNLDYILFLENPKSGVEFRQPDKGHMVKRTFNLLDQYLRDAIRKVQ